MKWQKAEHIRYCESQYETHTVCLSTSAQGQAVSKIERYRQHVKVGQTAASVSDCISKKQTDDGYPLAYRSGIGKHERSSSACLDDHDTLTDAMSGSLIVLWLRDVLNLVGRAQSTNWPNWKTRAERSAVGIVRDQQFAGLRPSAAAQTITLARFDETNPDSHLAVMVAGPTS
ncbi:hypothetical protein LTR10_003720 [Elasticomyces elasticus]|nr:hypothetical protein LTR10_003720 [Elasticomyces elasticus]KAK4978088.1 hypothetical protein LTR42_002465 [Elasticomyces elasticus]